MALFTWEGASREQGATCWGCSTNCPAGGSMIVPEQKSCYAMSSATFSSHSSVKPSPVMAEGWWSISSAVWNPLQQTKWLPSSSAHSVHHKSDHVYFLLSHLLGFRHFSELLSEGQMCQGHVIQVELKSHCSVCEVTTYLPREELSLGDQFSSIIASYRIL